MSSGKPISREMAFVAISQITALLDGACERLEVAGSYRRGKAEVHDIELVAVPKIEYRGGGADLFGQPLIATAVNLLDALIQGSIEHGGDFSPRPDASGRTAVGSKLKRLLYAQEFPLDLFIVTPPAQWGPVFTIRTGSADFSKALVTKRYAGGLCPNWMTFKDGAMWRAEKSGLVALETPTEIDVFTAMSLPWVDPADRRWPLPSAYRADLERSGIRWGVER